MHLNPVFLTHFTFFFLFFSAFGHVRPWLLSLVLGDSGELYVAGGWGKVGLKSVEQIRVFSGELFWVSGRVLALGWGCGGPRVSLRLLLMSMDVFLPRPCLSAVWLRFLLHPEPHLGSGILISRSAGQAQATVPLPPAGPVSQTPGHSPGGAVHMVHPAAHRQPLSPPCSRMSEISKISC